MGGNRSARPLGEGTGQRLARIPQGDPIQMDSPDIVIRLSGNAPARPPAGGRLQEKRYADDQVRITFWHNAPPRADSSHDVKWIRSQTKNPKQIAYTVISYDPGRARPEHQGGETVFKASIQLPVVAIYIPSELRNKQAAFDEVLKHELEHIRYAFEEMVEAEMMLGFDKFEYLDRQGKLTLAAVNQVLDASISRAPAVIIDSARRWDDLDLDALSHRLDQMNIFL